MNNDNDNIEKEGCLVFYDDEETNSTPRESGEQAVISIERQETDEEEVSASISRKVPSPHKWRWTALGIIASTMLCILLYGGWRMYSYYYRIGVPISVTPEENIIKLSKPVAKGAEPEIILTSDSIFGVALNIYELKNLRA